MRKGLISLNRQANVLSFEDSRRAFYARRSEAVPSRARAQRPAERTQRSRAPRPAVESYAPESSGSKVASLFAGLRGLASKNKAEKKFEKQFGGSQKSAEAAGPRAAVYRGEMGTQHKRATRMQDSPSQRPAASTRVAASSQKSPLTHRPLFIAFATFVACVLFASVFLYPTAQTYYQSIRENDRLNAEYQAVVARNAELVDQMASLSTNEGLSAYAHDRYGWIKPNENAVVVQGLTDQTKNGLDSVAANVIPGSVKAPDTWYSPFLDVFFGVK